MNLFLYLLKKVIFIVMGKNDKKDDNRFEKTQSKKFKLNLVKSQTMVKRNQFL